MDIKELRKWYDKKKEIYKELEGEAKYILEDALEENKFKYDRIESRVKNFNSLEAKVKRKEYIGITDLQGITDFLGIRIVCLFLSDLDKAKEIIQNEFEVISEDNKLEEGNVDQFGYQSIHYMVKLKDNLEGRRYNKLKNNSFEIQVRTLAMHSWANISHHLSYKTNDSIPQILKKDFYALSALLHVVDKNFEMIYKESKENKEKLKTLTRKEELLEKEIDLDTFKSYLELTLPTRRKATDRDYSEVVTELKEYGISKIKIIDEVLKIALKTAEEYEEAHPPTEIGGEKIMFLDIGILRVILQIITSTEENVDGKRRYKNQYYEFQKKIPQACLKDLKEKYDFSKEYKITAYSDEIIF